MPARNSLNVSLSPQLEKFIAARVANGQYQSASEVVREGLRLLQRQEEDRKDARRELKAKLRRGAAQARRGELSDGEEFLNKLTGALRSVARKNHAA